MIVASKRGFTLIELIGVLAIMAILASVIVPNMANEMTRSMSDAEDRELTVIATALQTWVEQNRSLPSTVVGGANGWDSCVATQLSVPLSRITQSKRNGTRRLIMDPGLAAPMGVATGYFQRNMLLAALPTTRPQVRFMIVSDLDRPVKANILTPAEFDLTWNQVPLNVLRSSAGFEESDSIRIERINLSAQMYPVSVNITDTTPKPAFALDAKLGGAPLDLSAAGPTVLGPFFLFKGTQIDLYMTAPPLDTIARIIVTGPLTLTFNGTGWVW